MRAQFTLTTATAERKVLSQSQSIAHAFNAAGTIVVPLNGTREKCRHPIRIPFLSIRMIILEINSILNLIRIETKSYLSIS